MRTLSFVPSIYTAFLFLVVRTVRENIGKLKVVLLDGHASRLTGSRTRMFHGQCSVCHWFEGAGLYRVNKRIFVCLFACLFFHV